MPGQLLDELYEPGVELDRRMSMACFHVMADLYNFTVRYAAVSTTWGYEEAEDKFNGMVGHLQREDIDFAVTGSENSIVRLKVSSFLPTIRFWKNSYILLQPSVVGGKFALAAPVDSKVWIALAFAILLFSCLFVIGSHLVAWLDESNQFKSNSHRSYQEIYSPASAIFLTFGLLAQQGVEKESEKTPLRIVCFVAIALFFLMFVFYNAEILNGLLSPSPATIQTLDDIVDSSYSVGYWNNPHIILRVNSNTSKLTKKLLAKSIRKGGVHNKFTLREGVKRVKNGKFAFLAGEPSAFVEIFRQFSNRDICSMTLITNHEWAYYISTLAKKFSPYTPFFRHGMALIKERGIKDREDKRWWMREPKCMRHTFVEPVAMESVDLAFYILLMGLLSAVTFLLFENIVFKVKFLKDNSRATKVNMKKQRKVMFT